MDPLERRILLALLRMMWRDAKAKGHPQRMASIADLGKTVRLTQPGERFVQ
jgi:hypothetical protein